MTSEIWERSVVFACFFILQVWFKLIILRQVTVCFPNAINSIKIKQILTSHDMRPLKDLRSLKDLSCSLVLYLSLSLRWLAGLLLPPEISCTAACAGSLSPLQPQHLQYASGVGVPQVHPYAGHIRDRAARQSLQRLPVPQRRFLHFKREIAGREPFVDDGDRQWENKNAG